jgi:hypothetical protein
MSIRLTGVHTLKSGVIKVRPATSNVPAFLTEDNLVLMTEDGFILGLEDGDSA